MNALKKVGFLLSLSLLVTVSSVEAQNQLHIAPQTIGLGQTDAEVPILVTNDQDLYGYSLSLTTPDTALLELKEVDLTGTPGEDADWSMGEAMNGGARISWGVILDMTKPFEIDKVIEPGTDQVLARLIVDVTAVAPAETTVDFQDFPADYDSVPRDPGSKNKLLLENGVGLEHTTVDGDITLGGDEGVGPFLRGDCNQDGANTGQVTDGVFLLNFLFTGGPEPICMAACDVNGDGGVPGDPTDAVTFFNFNFLGGMEPPEPLRACALSSTPGDMALGCEMPEGCTVP